MNSLIPFVSTHTQYVDLPYPGLTPNKIYNIIKWEKGEKEEGDVCWFLFVDDDGDLRRKILETFSKDSIRSDFKDYSFYRNLEKILK